MLLLTRLKNSAFAALAVLVLATPAFASVATNEPAPNFTLTDTNGQSHSLSDFRGKTVVLEWTNHDCPFVVKHYKPKAMQALQAEATADGVIWLSIISSAEGKQGYVTPEQANAIRAEHGIASTAMLLDTSGEVGRLYAAKTTPHMYIINAEGILVYQGAIDSIASANANDIAKADNYVRLALASLKAGEPIANPTTQPYGCSVKY